MRNRTYLSGVGFIALAGALAAAPAHASGETTVGPVDEEQTEAQSTGDDGPAAAPATAAFNVSLAPSSTFVGFRSDPMTVDLNSTVNLRLPRSSDRLATNPSLRPDPQIIARDDVGSAGTIDVNNTQPSVVQIFSQRNSDGGIFFNCTGSVINPRTILTAAHCVTATTTRSSEAYGLPETGAERTQLISTGVDSSVRFFNYLDFGSSYSEGGVASSTDVVIHASSNVGQGELLFPWADIALIAVDEPITDVPSLPLLLTPLTELTHVVHVGYGTFGVANGVDGGGDEGIGFLRRIGENMLGASASLADLGDVIFADFAPTSAFGFETQNYYMTDFDNPDRTQEEIDGCTLSGGGISCTDLAAVRAIDYFEGDALPNEVATAPGDSGSPLIADVAYDFPLAIGVLSGGIDFFGVEEGYGDISFYNPLYQYFEFISENTAYKYVSAAEGDGVWSDPSRWTQDLDPGFFVDDGNGNLVNGIPGGSEPGVYGNGPNLGIILGVDASTINSDQSPILPPEGTPNFGANTPNSSVLLGPGSTGFVPNNTDGTPGTAFANPAQYFEVHLNNAGTTTVDMDVEIDKLVIDNVDAGFVLSSPWDFTSIIEVEQFGGYSQIDGSLSTPFYFLVGGELAGEGGVINTNALFNIEGLVNAGGSDNFGTLTINGDYLQTSGAGLWADFSVDRRRNVTSDFYDISGTAILDGLLILSSDDRRVRFGTEFTILSADAIDGDFADSVSLINSVVLEATHRIEDNDVVVKITARSIADIIASRRGMRSLGSALDTIRATNFNGFVGLFDIVDNAGFDTFGETLASLTPVSAFNQNFTANAFSQRFTGQVAQRTLTLRDGSRAAGAFTAAGNASYSLVGGAPVEQGKIGVFGSASGVYLNGGQQVGVLEAGSAGYSNAFEQAALSQAGEITVGADVQVSEGFSFGVAVSNIRSSQLETSLLQPEADRSTAVAIYGTYSSGGMFADGYAGTADQRLGAERASRGDFSPYYDSAVGQSDAKQVFGGLRLGYAFDLARGVEVGPVVSMDYVRNDIGGYDEIGAGTFGLSIADRTFTSLGAKVGMMGSLDLPVGQTGTVRAFGSVAYARELADNADVVTARFFGASDVPFTIENGLDPEWVSVNAGAEIDLGLNLRAALSVTSDMGRGPLSNEQAQATLSWRF